MSKSTHLLWIAEAEARSLQDFTLMQHASSEPCVTVSPVDSPVRSNCWRRLIAHLTPAARNEPMTALDAEPPGHAKSARSLQLVHVETSFDAQRT